MTALCPAIIDSPTLHMHIYTHTHAHAAIYFLCAVHFYKFYNLLEFLSVEKIAAWPQFIMVIESSSIENCLKKREGASERGRERE